MSAGRFRVELAELLGGIAETDEAQLVALLVRWGRRGLAGEDPYGDRRPPEVQ